MRLAVRRLLCTDLLNLCENIVRRYGILRRLVTLHVLLNIVGMVTLYMMRVTLVRRGLMTGAGMRLTL